MSRKLYVNNLEFSNYINPEHNSGIMDIKRINIKEFISGMLDKKLIKELDDRYAENDPYLMPIYIILPLINEIGDTLYFIDEYYTNGTNTISFLGDTLHNDTDTNISKMDEEEFYQFIHDFIICTIEDKFTRSKDVSFALSFYGDIRDELGRYITIDTTRDIELQYYQYVLGTGLFFYTNPIIMKANTYNLAELDYMTYRNFKLRKDRDRFDIDNIKYELKSDTETDCRVDQFNIVTNLFELIKLCGIQK